MLKNDQTHFKDVAVQTPQVWPFFNIMHERDKTILAQKRNLP